jgi:hypothetical protein
MTGRLGSAVVVVVVVVSAVVVVAVVGATVVVVVVANLALKHHGRFVPWLVGCQQQPACSHKYLR